jgi:hypothetical protein
VVIAKSASVVLVATAAWGLLVSLSGGGCGNCDEVGCVSGAQVALVRVPGGARQAKEVRLCAHQTCKSFRHRGGQSLALLAIPTLRRERPLRVSVAVRGRRGRMLGRGEGSFRARRSQPNGPGCEPTCYGLSLRLDVRRGMLSEIRR